MERTKNVLARRLLLIVIISLLLGKNNVSEQEIDVLKLNARCPSGSSDTSCTESCPKECKQACNHLGKCLVCSEKGVQLPTCTTPCENGTYGLHCASKCGKACLHSECEQKTGNCIQCKVAGVRLPDCVSPCPPRTYGLHCQHRCPSVCLTKCDPIKGECTECTHGKGPECTVNCAVVTSRGACKAYCPKKCLTWCNTTDGRCSTCSAGYMPPLCSDLCSPGYYGINCKLLCSVRCKDSQCEPQTGKCLACREGYVGRQCTGRCVSGLYGDHCSQSCPETCAGQRCDFRVGHCFQCVAGYRGDMCQELCDKMEHGVNCSQRCNQSCRSGCDPVSGRCRQCAAGFSGQFCNITCAQGSYGDRCRNQCSAGCMDDLCHHVSGHCLKCKPNVQGDFCTETVGIQTPSQLELVILIVFVLFVPFAVVLVVLGLYRRRFSKMVARYRDASANDGEKEKRSLRDSNGQGGVPDVLSDSKDAQTARTELICSPSSPDPETIKPTEANVERLSNTPYHAIASSTVLKFHCEEIGTVASMSYTSDVSHASDHKMPLRPNWDNDEGNSESQEDTKACSSLSSNTKHTLTYVVNGARPQCVTISHSSTTLEEEITNVSTCSSTAGRMVATLSNNEVRTTRVANSHEPSQSKKSTEADIFADNNVITPENSHKENMHEHESESRHLSVQRKSESEKHSNPTISECIHSIETKNAHAPTKPVLSDSIQTRVTTLGGNGGVDLFHDEDRRECSAPPTRPTRRSCGPSPSATCLPHRASSDGHRATPDQIGTNPVVSGAASQPNSDAMQGTYSNLSIDLLNSLSNQLTTGPRSLQSRTTSGITVDFSSPGVNRVATQSNSQSNDGNPLPQVPPDKISTALMQIPPGAPAIPIDDKASETKQAVLPLGTGPSRLGEENCRTMPEHEERLKLANQLSSATSGHLLDTTGGKHSMPVFGQTAVRETSASSSVLQGKVAEDNSTPGGSTSALHRPKTRSNTAPKGRRGKKVLSNGLLWNTTSLLGRVASSTSNPVDEPFSLPSSWDEHKRETDSSHSFGIHRDTRRNDDWLRKTTGVRGACEDKVCSSSSKASSKPPLVKKSKFSLPRVTPQATENVTSSDSSVLEEEHIGLKRLRSERSAKIKSGEVKASEPKTKTKMSASSQPVIHAQLQEAKETVDKPDDEGGNVAEVQESTSRAVGRLPPGRVCPATPSLVRCPTTRQLSPVTMFTTPVTGRRPPTLPTPPPDGRRTLNPVRSRHSNYSLSSDIPPTP